MALCRIIMAKNIFLVIGLEAFILQVFGSPFCPCQQPIQTRTPQSVTFIPSSSSCSFNPGQYQSYPTPTSRYTSVQSTFPPTELSVPSKKTFTDPKSKTTPPALDSAVLNNLAIALQLLIVSNLLNTPPEEIEECDFERALLLPGSIPSAMYDVLSMSGPKASTVPSHPAAQSQSAISITQSKQVGLPSYPCGTSMPSQIQPYYYQNKPEQQLALSYSEPVGTPNANFAGSFGDSCLKTNLGLPGAYGSPYAGSGSSNTRSSMTLMSPYEALSPSSPYSDPILSSSYGSYGSYGGKKAFQSPYESILAADGANDLFGMDFF